MRLNKHIIRITACAIMLATSLTAFAAAEEQAFSKAKDAFTAVWQSAADSTRKQTVLEESLKDVDARVEKAKSELEQVGRQRLNLRLEIQKRRELIGALSEQLGAVNDSRIGYLLQADTQRDELKTFIRYLGGKQIEIYDTGPVIGGQVMRKILRGSLGDSIERELNHSALLKARTALIGQLAQLAEETDSAKARIQSISMVLEQEMSDLEKRSSELVMAADKHAAAIDDGWKQRVLTEQELLETRQEFDAAAAQIEAMQSDLMRLNLELKAEKIKELSAQLAEVKAGEQKVLDKKAELERMDKHWKTIEDNEHKTFKKVQDLRNSDTKLYKRIEEAGLEIRNKRGLYEEIYAQSAGSGTVVSEDEESAGQAVLAGIEFLEQAVEQMKTGIPFEPAKEYVKARKEAKKAAEERRLVLIQIKTLVPEINAFSPKITELEKAIADVENDSGLNGLPIFAWPVRGRITAGFYDPDYKEIFGVVHKAIDIAVVQGTPVRTVADGFVYAVKDGGAKGYTYVLIGHRDGYASLYGHLSKVFVSPGEMVNFGQTIGLSGGIPGTPGSGPMTTGAHLHLEIMKDGEHVDPLTVLTK